MTTRFRNLFWWWVVFLAGAATMIFEILLGRIFSSHFGSTASTWGNLIGVILFGLAIGYSAGGHLVVRFPSSLIPGMAFVLSGLAIFLSPHFAPGICSRVQSWGWADPFPSLGRRD